MFEAPALIDDALEQAPQALFIQGAATVALHVVNDLTLPCRIEDLDVIHPFYLRDLNRAARALV